MPESLLLFVAFLQAFVGMAWLALAMPVHWQQVHDTRPLPHWRTLVLRVTAAVALSASGCACLNVDHPSIAVLVWVMLLAVSAWITAFMLA
jgi:hypothetical protein